MGREELHVCDGVLPNLFLCQMYPIISGNMHSSSPTLGHKLKWASSHVRAFIVSSIVILEAGRCLLPVDHPS